MSNVNNSNNNKQIATLSDCRILKGQRAWTKIKATAKEQRELWRDVGGALNAIRVLHPSDKEYGQALKQYGFDDIKPATRSDALWFYMFYSTTIVDKNLPVELTHPVAIRQWHREQYVRYIQLPPDLQELPIETKVLPTLDIRTAERVAKVINRSTAGGEGSDIATKHVESIAKKHGVTVSDLKEAVATTVPTIYHKFNVEQLKAIEEYRSGVMEDADNMVQSGIPKEAIRHIFLSIANQMVGE